MKKVVNGRVYDTDAASTVLSWMEDSYVAGLHVAVQYRLNRMYQLKEGIPPEDAVKLTSWGSADISLDKVDRSRGEFFISVEFGGWAEDSRRIQPISDDEAKAIIERHASYEEYVRWFGDPRGLAPTLDAVRKAIDARSAKACENERRLTAERDAAKARVEELERRLASAEA